MGLPRERCATRWPSDGSTPPPAMPRIWCRVGQAYGSMDGGGRAMQNARARRPIVWPARVGHIPRGADLDVPRSHNLSHPSGIEEVPLQGESTAPWTVAAFSLPSAPCRPPQRHLRCPRHRHRSRISSSALRRANSSTAIPVPQRKIALASPAGGAEHHLRTRVRHPPRPARRAHRLARPQARLPATRGELRCQPDDGPQRAAHRAHCAIGRILQSLGAGDGGGNTRCLMTKPPAA